MNKLKRRKGVTMVELLGVMVVIAVLLGIAGWSVTANIKRSNRESVANELQLYATSFSDAYYDLGAPSFSPGDAGAQAEFERYLNLISSDYLSVAFDTSTITATANGFEVDIAEPLDVYEANYHCWFVTDDSVMKYVMVASGGENRIIDSDGYVSKDFGDDIVMIVRPKI